MKSYGFSLALDIVLRITALGLLFDPIGLLCSSNCVAHISMLSATRSLTAGSEKSPCQSVGFVALKFPSPNNFIQHLKIQLHSKFQGRAIYSKILCQTATQLASSTILKYFYSSLKHMRAASLVPWPIGILIFQTSHTVAHRAQLTTFSGFSASQNSSILLSQASAETYKP